MRPDPERYGERTPAASISRRRRVFLISIPVIQPESSFPRHVRRGHEKKEAASIRTTLQLCVGRRRTTSSPSPEKYESESPESRPWLSLPPSVSGRAGGKRKRESLTVNEVKERESNAFLFLRPPLACTAAAAAAAAAEGEKAREPLSLCPWGRSRGNRGRRRPLLC